jgi:hypothetical protein
MALPARRARLVLALGLAAAFAGAFACGTQLEVQPSPDAGLEDGAVSADGMMMMQGDVAAPDGGAVPGPDASFRVFVTSGSWLGDLEGGAPVSVGRGDALCQAAATAAGLKGIFRAWLSDSDGGAAARLPSTAGVPYRRVDDVVVVKTFSDFTRTGSAVLDQPIDHDENGDRPPVDDVVWTGTAAGGAAAPATCQDWSNPSGLATGIYGRMNHTDETWTVAAAPIGCVVLGHLYCMQTTQ